MRTESWSSLVLTRLLKLSNNELVKHLSGWLVGWLVGCLGFMAYQPL